MERLQSSFSQLQPTNATTRGSRLVYTANAVLVRQQLSNTPGDVVFVVPPQCTYTVTSFSLFNSDYATTATVTLRLVAPDGVNDPTSDYWEWAMDPRGQKYCTVEEVLTPGYQIVAFADSTNLVNIKINGVNLVQQ